MGEKIKSLTLKDLVDIVEQTIDHYDLTLPDSYQVRLDLLRELANDPNIHPARPNELDFRRADVLIDYMVQLGQDQLIDRVVTTRGS